MTKRLQLALWAGNEVVWEYVIDEDCFYLYKNMSGGTANIAKVGTFDDALAAYHKDDQQMASDNWFAHLDGNKTAINFTARLFTEKKDAFRWNLIKAKRIFDERTGHATKIIGIFKDIHEEYIRELSYKVINKAFLRSRTPGFVIDFSTKHIEVSDSFYQFVGKEREDVRQKELQALLPTEEINTQQCQHNYRFIANLTTLPDKTLACQFQLHPMLEDKMANNNFRFAVGTFQSVPT